MKWYSNSADNSDIVLSTRIRLARNLRDYPFPARLDSESRKEVNAIVKDALLNDGNKDEFDYIEMSSLTPSQAVSLAEKHLISPEFASSSSGRALILSKDEDVSIMLCEEDHVRIQIIYPGLSLDSAFQKAEEFDGMLEKSTAIAFDEKLGYLTQCPTNLGTGLRASVMLHLPAIAKTGAMPRLASTVAKLGLTLRGAYGEGSQPAGDIFQLDFVYGTVDVNFIFFHVIFLLRLYFLNRCDADSGNVLTHVLSNSGGDSGDQCALISNLDLRLSGRSSGCSGNIFCRFAANQAHQRNQHDNADQTDKHRSHAHQTYKKIGIVRHVFKSLPD